MKTQRLISSHESCGFIQNRHVACCKIFEVSKTFPKEEAYSLTDQIRCSSRQAVCANLAEAWRKRQYQAAFVSKTSDAEGEAAETQVWLELAVRCGYLPKEIGKRIYDDYDTLLGACGNDQNSKEKWDVIAS